MIRGLLRKVLKPIVGKRKAAAAAEGLDALAKKALDKRTGGLASKVDDAL